MHVHLLEWILTLVVTIAVLSFDVLATARGSGEPTMRRSALALSVYVGLAVCFGIWTGLFHGQQYAIQFFAGWLTEYSLSVDNLFVFVIIMASFGVPRAYQREALFIGIVIALIFRGVFIALGAAAIQRFSWMFYIFGGFLVYTAVQLARGGTHEADPENAVVRFVRNHMSVTDDWHGRRLVVEDAGRRSMTPMALVVIALGVTDLVFALDSIPAIYGLTSEAYLVLAANVFALMGLRQLYFIVEGLLQRLVYLSKGLAVVLVLIGVKLILHALRGNDLPFINGGRHIDVPEIPTSLSLGAIAVTLVVAAIASVIATRD